MRKALTAVFTALLVAGCAGTSPPTSFYGLDAGPSVAPIAQLPHLSLGLGPIVLPDTLDRPQIVTQSAPYRRELAEFHRWTGGLNTEMGRLMAARLMQDLGTDRVFLHPWPRHREPKYQIRIDILGMGGRLGEQAYLHGTWTLLDGEGRRELRLEAFALEQAAVGASYKHLVAALSDLVIRLTDKIAGGVLESVSAKR